MRKVTCDIINLQNFQYVYQTYFSIYEFSYVCFLKTCKEKERVLV